MSDKNRTDMTLDELNEDFRKSWTYNAPEQFGVLYDKCKQLEAELAEWKEKYHEQTSAFSERIIQLGAENKRLREEYGHIDGALILEGKYVKALEVLGWYEERVAMLRSQDTDLHLKSVDDLDFDGGQRARDAMKK